MFLSGVLEGNRRVQSGTRVSNKRKSTLNNIATYETESGSFDSS